MAVDSERDSYHVNRISPALLDTNWAAQAYRPDVIRAVVEVKKLGQWATLKEITRGAISQGRTPEYSESGKGIRCLKTRHVIGIEINRNDPDWVTCDFAVKHPNLALLLNDIVVNRSGSGSIGRAGIYLYDDKPFTNEHLIRMRVAPPHDAAFVCAFLNTWWGERALERGVTGATGQLNLAVEYIQDVVVPTPNKDAQLYIGAKVRNAEKLREVARKTVESVELFHSALIPSFDFEKKKKNNCVSSLRLGERLDAEHYPAEVKDYFDNIVKSQIKSLDCCCTEIFTGSTLSEAKNSGVYQVTVTNLDTSFLSSPYRNVVSSKSLQKKLQDHDLLICAAAHMASYIGKDITYSIVDGTIIPSTEVIVIRPDHSKVPSSYVRTFLRTKIGYLSLQATVRGITAHAYPADLSEVEIPIPVFDSKEGKNRWFRADEEMLVAGKSFCAGFLLTKAARILVEALIDQKVTEADLIAAHKDPAKDRELLSRLTPKGIDVPGEPPLFPDLDALFELLAEKGTEVA